MTKALAVSFFAMCLGNVFAGDTTPVAVDQLPPLVQKKLQKDFAKAVAISAEKEDKNDYIHYFITLQSGETRRVVEVLENGEIVPEKAH